MIHTIFIHIPFISWYSMLNFPVPFPIAAENPPSLDWALPRVSEAAPPRRRRHWRNNLRWKSCGFMISPT